MINRDRPCARPYLLGEVCDCVKRLPGLRVDIATALIALHGIGDDGSGFWWTVVGLDAAGSLIAALERAGYVGVGDVCIAGKRHFVVGICDVFANSNSHAFGSAVVVLLSLRRHRCQRQGRDRPGQHAGNNHCDKDR